MKCTIRQQGMSEIQLGCIYLFVGSADVLINAICGFEMKYVVLRGN